MLRLHWLALALLFPVSATAQLEVSSITDPIRPDRAPLALTEEVPAIFHLGMDTPASVFANPARAAHAKQRFIYGTIRPGGGSRPLSFAALFGSRDRRWLITVENHVSSFNGEDASRNESVRMEPNFMETRSDSRDTASDQVFADTRARVLLVGRTDFGGYAFGLYGGYRNMTSNRTTSSTSNIRLQQQLFSPETEQTIFDTNEDVRTFEREGFGIGAEMALAGRTWDLAAAASYQRRSVDAEASLRSLDTRLFEERFENGTLNSSFDEARIDNQTRADGTPTAIDFEVLGTLRAARDRDDYLFGSVNGTFGTGTANAALLREQERVRRTNNDGTISGDTTLTSTEGQGELNLNSNITRASLGYVYAMKKRGLTILAAVNPVAGFETVDGVAVNGFGSAQTLTQREDKVTSLGLVLPLHVRFNVTKRLDAFGGGSYTYAYSRTETDVRPLPTRDMGGETSFEQATERTTDAFVSSSALYAGAMFTFRSGLTAQAAFQGDLAALNRWTVSLGYRF